MTDPGRIQDPLQRAVFTALSAADAVAAALQGAATTGALAEADHRQTFDLHREIEAGNIFEPEHIPAIRSLSASLEASIQAATISHFHYDECDMSDGHQEHLTAQGQDLVILRARLNALAHSLAEVQNHRRSKRIAEKLRS
ncbi:hypothetical protein [Limimaricola litoreus]|uniref:Uncharacterized protein n=1 Tax=Limimaricola litoreus TaxID=2955316 RepID=A0A9X2FPD4_9RHOB|nr:hypothetical protein [Limimaricola litoreus]MCP1168896.1 hypothetical protein [Limimaricola litoreus]